MITKWDAPINARLDAEAITESELEKRCISMCVHYEKYGVINTQFLLNGELKKGGCEMERTFIIRESYPGQLFPRLHP